MMQPIEQQARAAGQTDSNNLNFREKTLAVEIRCSGIKTCTGNHAQNSSYEFFQLKN